MNWFPSITKQTKKNGFLHVSVTIGYIAWRLTYRVQSGVVRRNYQNYFFYYFTCVKFNIANITLRGFLRNYTQEWVSFLCSILLVNPSNDFLLDLWVLHIILHINNGFLISYLLSENEMVYIETVDEWNRTKYQ